jgi:flavin reductase (DIM6/NTAB) family NADH-FMN oxidoreductase RutF
MDVNGVVNAAPFSYFNVVCTAPAVVSVSIGHRQGQRKDTARNIIEKREFVINICSVELARAISLSAGDFPSEISEIELAQLSLIPSLHVSVPRVANTLAQLECVLHQVVGINDYAVDLFLGAVVKVHVHKKVIDTQGRIDVRKLKPLARLAGLTFAGVEGFFEIPRGLPAKE